MLPLSLFISRRYLVSLCLLLSILLIACSGSNASDDADADALMSDGIIGPPTITRAQAGEGQSATVNTAVAIAPQILVTDADGDPVPGVEVTFSVVDGGGQASDTVQTTDTQGLAAVGGWTLGPIPGENILVAEVPGLAPVNFVATATADARGSMTVWAGNNQYARAGSAVAQPPAVVVQGQDGNPIAGRSVVFAIVEGDGQIMGAETIVTGDDGVAALDAWILGATPGDNVLSATTDDLPSLTFNARGVAEGTPALQRTVWLDNLNVPWDLAFTPDGAALITERGGRLLVLLPGADAPTTLLTGPDDLNPRTQSGLLSVAIDPQFQTNRFIYTFVSSNRSGAMDNRVRKWRVAEDYTSIEEVGDILTGIPWGSDGGHSGGRMRFGPDGFLYITSGDNRSATIPQSLTGPQALGGKVMRITTDGQPAPGNPDLGPDTPPTIYAYGFRNPQGISFQPISGAPFLCEHGPNQDDEVTRLRAGGNGGWNPNDGAGNYNGYDGAVMTDLNQFPDAMRPAMVVSDSEGMSGCTFLTGNQWLSWEGRLAVGFLLGRRVTIMEPRPDALAPPLSASNELEGLARIRSMVQGPDGALYIVIDAEAPNGQIWRVTP